MELCSSADDASRHRTLFTPSFSSAWWRSLVVPSEDASQRDLIKFLWENLCTWWWRFRKAF